MLAQVKNATQQPSPLQQADLLSAKRHYVSAANIYIELALQNNADAQPRQSWLYEADRGAAQDLAGLHVV